MDIFFEDQQPQMATTYNDITSLPLIGDCIGMESCVHPMIEEDIIVPCKREVKHEKKLPRKEFPPPITLLARTGNLPAHMPWVLRRQYTSDGRLILTEERVRHHEYMKVNRENGRLTLQLVPLDHQVFGNSMHEFEDCDEEDEAEASGCLDGDEEEDGTFFENGDVNDNDRYRNLPELSVEHGVGDGGKSSGGKCLKYNTSSVGLHSGCIFGVPVPAISQVL